MKKLLFLFTSFLFAFLLQAQVTRFDKVYNIWNEYAMNNFQQTADGGYILNTDSPPEQDSVTDFAKGCLIKMDAQGNTQWIRRYAKTNYAIKSSDGNSVFQTKDGGYIIGTVLYTSWNPLNFTGNNTAIYLIKTDASGNFVWSKTYPGIGSSMCYCVKQTDDFGYIVCGATMDTITYLTKTYLLKTDISGNVQWGKTYEESASGQSGNAFCVNQTSDGGYVVTGQSYSGTFIMKTDGNGNILWNNNMGIAGADILYCAKQTSDGGYIATGYGAASSHNGTILLKLNGSGNIQWQKEYNVTNTSTSSYDEGYSVEEEPGGYTVLDLKDDTYNGLMKTDASGNVQWATTYLTNSSYSPSSLERTTDGGYAFTSIYYEFNSGVDIVKTDSLGTTACSSTPQTIIDTVYSPVTHPGFIAANAASSYVINTVFTGATVGDSLLCPTNVDNGIVNFPNENSVSIFPNPTSGNISVQMNALSGNKISIDVFDVLGQNVMEKENDNASGIFQQMLDLSAMSDGIYFVAIKVDDKIISTKKIVKGN